jgi:hypothetical protein
MVDREWFPQHPAPKKRERAAETAELSDDAARRP